jgi:hypothetical protein
MNRPDRQINHPGRKLTLQYIDYICIAATPPSKEEPAPLRRGETYTNISCHKTTLRLTAMGQGDVKDKILRIKGLIG